MQTIELPYEIGEKVYVLTYCSLIRNVSETLGCGDKGAAILEYCPFLGNDCPYGILSASDCVKNITWKSNVFKAEIAGYEYDRHGLKFELKEFMGTYDADRVFSTREEAQAALDALYDGLLGQTEV